jgi:hypothetical protein
MSLQTKSREVSRTSADRSTVVNDGRFLDDAQSLDALIQMLPVRLRDEYLALRALTLEAGFPNRRMIVYTLKDGQPSKQSMLLLGDMDMARIAGPTITIADEAGPVTVGVSPVKWRDRDLFIHIPQNFIFKWKGKPVGAKGVQFVPHYAVLIKTRSKEHHQVEGDTYCVTLNKFRERFPEIPIRY